MHTHCVHAHTHAHSSFIFIHSFLCTRTLAQTRTDKHACTQTILCSTSFRVSLSAALPVLCAFLCKKVTLTSIYLNENNRNAGNWTGLIYLLLPPHYCRSFKAQRVHAEIRNTHIHLAEWMYVQHAVITKVSFVCALCCRGLTMWWKDNKWHSSTFLTWRRQNIEIKDDPTEAIHFWHSPDNFEPLMCSWMFCDWS